MNSNESKSMSKRQVFAIYFYICLCGAIFITCMKSIFLQNVLHLILGFMFGVWASYFDFHKFNIKEINFEILNSRNMDIFMVYIV